MTDARTAIPLKEMSKSQWRRKQCGLHKDGEAFVPLKDKLGKTLNAHNPADWEIAKELHQTDDRYADYRDWKLTTRHSSQKKDNRIRNGEKKALYSGISSSTYTMFQQIYGPQLNAFLTERKRLREEEPIEANKCPRNQNNYAFNSTGWFADDFHHEVESQKVDSAPKTSLTF